MSFIKKTILVLLLVSVCTHAKPKPPGSREVEEKKHEDVVAEKEVKIEPVKAKAAPPPAKKDPVAVEPPAIKEKPVAKKEEESVVKIESKEEPKVVSKSEPKHEEKHVEPAKVEDSKNNAESHVDDHKKITDKHPSGHGGLASSPKCADDVEKFCGKLMKKSKFTDLQVVRCLQEALEREDDVSEECEQEMWNFKLNLTKNPLLDAGARKLCPDSIKAVEECQHAHVQNKDGFLTSCLLEHREEVKEERCHKFLKTLASVVFSDYRLISGFYTDCEADVKALNCGMISLSKEKDDEEKQHEQGDVVGCLNAELEKVKSDKCKKQLVRIAELSANDYHLDRPLFYACQSPRERYCHDVKSGEGRVYKCLLKHIDEEVMPEDCKTKLKARQNLIQESKKTNYALWHACKGDFEKYKCESKGDKSADGEASHLLLCLQEQVAEGNAVTGECKDEMRDVAEMIFENYKISPVIVRGCDTEINQHCKDHIGSQDNGAMMDCLMTIAANNNSLSTECFESVTTVLKETGAGNNYKVDRALYHACESAITSLCDHKDDTLIMGCLMDNVHNPKMPELCATQVFHLQYFLSRDFRLDASLYHDCKKDAEEICNAKDFAEKAESKQDADSTLPHNFVIACLYRNSIMPVEGHSVTHECSGHIKRVMHQRATNIRLMPEIEQPCMTDLGQHCLDKANGEGEEIECLQENYETLSANCQKAIKEFSELEGRDFDLNYHLANKCGAMASKFCKRELDEEDGERVIPCLISVKNDIEMDHLCADAIEHWQIMEMKDYNFSPEFSKLCLNDIVSNCKEQKTKTDAIRCLSQTVVSDNTKVSSKCRSQLKKELLKQSEDIKLMPHLYKACEKDIRTFCKDVPAGGAQLEECLRKHHKSLQSEECRTLLFEEEKEESQDPELDYRLMHVCKPMIKRYCMDYSSPLEIVECLRQQSHDRDMSNECRDIIKERQVEQAESFTLDAELSSYCKADAEKYCKVEIDRLKLKGGADENGEVFSCLVDNLMKKMKLATDCENFVRRREAEAAMDIELNPQVFQHCHDEMERVCPKVEPDDMIDCLKANLPQIKSKACQAEIKKLIVEGIEDVHVDPHLESTCTRDIRTFCGEVPKKSGHVVLCLIDVHKAQNLHLQPECENFLAKRLDLYNAAKVNPATFDSIANVIEAVQASPNRNSVYMAVMLLLGVLFIGGIMFGRVTKKAHVDMKNR